MKTSSREICCFEKHINYISPFPWNVQRTLNDVFGRAPELSRQNPRRLSKLGRLLPWPISLRLLIPWLLSASSFSRLLTFCWIIPKGLQATSLGQKAKERMWTRVRAPAAAQNNSEAETGTWSPLLAFVTRLVRKIGSQALK